MRALFGRISPRKALGLYVGERELTASLVAATLLGPVEVARRTQPCEADRVGEALDRLLAPFLTGRRRRRLPVALGLPPLRVFFSTRPTRSAKKDATPQVLLHEVLQSPTLSVDELAVDLLKGQPGKREVACLVSCRKKYLNHLLASLDGRPTRLIRAEPAPCALLRVAAYRQPAPWRARTLVRVFLNAGEGLAVAVAAGLPIVWRSFELTAGTEVSALRSAIRSIQALLPACGIDAPLDTVLIHGRPELHAQLASDEVCSRDFGARVVTAAAPALEGGDVAFGLALGCLSPDKTAFDLARACKPQPGLLELLPWSETALQGAVLACMGLFLSHRATNLDNGYRAARGESARSRTLTGSSEAALRKEKQDLGQKVEAVRQFCASRVPWTAYTHDLANRLPARVTLTSFQGLSELPSTDKKKAQMAQAKRSLVLKASAPIAAGGTTPPEVDQFLGSLRGHPLLKRDFPVVELTDLRWQQSGAKEKPLASFTVVCLPKVIKVAPPARKKGKKP